jgi:hypothetical protein
MVITPTERLTLAPDSTALILKAEVWTHHQPAGEAEQVAPGLVASGLTASDRVVFHTMKLTEMMVVAPLPKHNRIQSTAPIDTAFGRACPEASSNVGGSAKAVVERVACDK